MMHFKWALCALVLSASLWAASAAAQVIPGEYIVVLRDGRGGPAEVAAAHALVPKHVYTKVFQGFAAHVPDAALAGLMRNPRVLSVQPDRVVNAIGQVVSTGVARMEGYPSPGRLPVDAGIAIIDSGIDLTHPDLNVVYGVDCRKLNRKTGDCLVGGNDDNGHGSHCAGIAAAKDNDLGVVGVAPGARLYAVKVLGSSGSGTLSGVIQGMDWVARNAATRGIDVANLSLGGTGHDDTDGNPNGCLVTLDAEHKAICGLVASGVTVVVAAGNELDDSANHTPGAFDEVITVSALADFDGMPGGFGQATYAFNACTENVDDSLACFSNFGHDVDLLAPGVGIYSTSMAGGYETMSGTSMAAPHVAGAVALVASWSETRLTPQQVKATLIAEADPAPCSGPGGVCADDPDGVQEPLCMVGTPPPCQNDAWCDDGEPCNGAEACVAGACFPGTEITFCANADGCCPAGCEFSIDDDCQPPAYCGDGVCAGTAGGENCTICRADCACIGPACKNGCCGNGRCEKGETATACPVDCG